MGFHKSVYSPLVGKPRTIWMREAWLEVGHLADISVSDNRPPMSAEYVIRLRFLRWSIRRSFSKGTR